jgi:hypothetical protein
MNTERKIKTDERFYFCKYGKVQKYQNVSSKTKQNLVHEEIEIRMDPEKSCHHSFQNCLSSRYLSKTSKIKIYRNKILSVVLYGFETWSLTLREEHRLTVF